MIWFLVAVVILKYIIVLLMLSAGDPGDDEQNVGKKSDDRRDGSKYAQGFTAFVLMLIFFLVCRLVYKLC